MRAGERTGLRVGTRQEGSAQQGLLDASFSVENLSVGSQTNAPITFGQVFKVGDVPSGTSPVISGQSTQVDAKANHADGSLRHAVLTFRVPSINGSATNDYTLANGSPASGTAISRADVLATAFDAVITLTEGGSTYTASAATLLNNQTGLITWLEGPLVSEWLVSDAVRSGGAAHAHLQARFEIRAYKTGGTVDSVRVACILENGWTYETSPGDKSITNLSITVGGAQVYTNASYTHYHHARWVLRYWWGTEPELHAKHDAEYLINTRAMPSYDKTLIGNIQESKIAADYASYISSSRDIMDISLVNSYMGEKGGRWDIGPLPGWAAQSLFNMDSRSWESTLKQADLGGSWGIHFRDKTTDLPVSIVDDPNISIHFNNYTLPSPSPNGSTYQPDNAHQPGLSFFPYVLTGDHYHLEELLFWNTWNQIHQPADWRDYANGYVWKDQRRAQAWSMRTLAQAAYITPDSHSMKSYWDTLIDNNITWYNNEHPFGNPPYPNLGFLSVYYAVDQGFLWQDSFFTWAIGYAYHLGFTDALPMVEYKIKTMIGCMTDADYCWLQASNYNHSSTGYSDSFASLYATQSSWPQPASTNCICGSGECSNSNSVLEMVGYPSNTDGFPANLQIAIATAAEFDPNNLVNGGGANAWTKFQTRDPKPDYTYGTGSGITGASFAIVPFVE